MMETLWKYKFYLLVAFAAIACGTFLMSCAGHLNQQQNIPLLTPDNDVKCSAVLISEHLVLTAAHCIHEPTQMVACR